MSALGPDLPPHLLVKRKRRQEDEVDEGPLIAPGAKPSPSSSEGEKRRRVMGPAMPPANLDERPEKPSAESKPAQDSDSDDVDEFGPALPAPGNGEDTLIENPSHKSSEHGGVTTTAPKQQRDEWMTMAPRQDDLAARMDPSRPRARGFNTGKGARAPGAKEEDSSAWYETPEQKQKRLADEMMGVSKPSSVGPGRPANGADVKRDKLVASQIQENTEKHRGPSLVDLHEKAKGKETVDDPSKRAFDREKDMATGSRIGHTQRRDLLNKASGYSSKFAGGSYL